MSFRSTLASSALNYFENRARRKLYADARLRNFLESVQSPSTGCAYSDYWALYSYIVSNKPREVLELGSGVSTVILALAAEKSGVTRITSMEESPEYAAATRKIIPESLAHLVDLQQSPSTDYTYGPFTGKVYEHIPDKPYDFVFIDGPQYDAKTSFDADIVRLAERTTTPFSYLVDTRTGSCFMYHLLFREPLRYDYLKRKGFGSVPVGSLLSYPQIVARAMKHRAFPRIVL